MKIIVNRSYGTEHLSFVLDSYEMVGTGNNELTMQLLILPYHRGEGVNMYSPVSPHEQQVNFRHQDCLSSLREGE